MGYVILNRSRPSSSSSTHAPESLTISAPNPGSKRDSAIVYNPPWNSTTADFCITRCIQGTPWRLLKRMAGVNFIAQCDWLRRRRLPSREWAMNGEQWGRAVCRVLRENAARRAPPRGQRPRHFGSVTCERTVWCHGGATRLYGAVLDLDFCSETRSITALGWPGIAWMPLPSDQRWPVPRAPAVLCKRSDWRLASVSNGSQSFGGWPLASIRLKTR
ncbi:hypothetical protein LMG9673_03957 [Ralstonia pseudosolanacearum]|nr:hypothetical protein LMG9673_03957 [Ralstonia pseudosolanacearum]